jgi:hypothetical protein
MYLGFLWDLAAQTVTILETKRSKYLRKVTLMLDSIDRGHRISHADAMSVNGTLSHVCFVVSHGRAYMPNLCHFISSFKNEFAHRYAPHSMTSDLRWWQEILSSPTHPRYLVKRSKIDDLDIWVDASTSFRIGILISGHWAAWKLPDSWKTDHRDISWAEAIALEISVRCLERMGIRHASVLIRSDNKGVIGAFHKGRGKNFQVNLVLRRIQSILMSNDISLALRYVESDDNRSDPFSRGEKGPDSLKISDLPSLPDELKPYLAYV